ncbi:MAG: molybdenum cofactor guanylyltransferase [Acidimicrobiia bacterium]|nr:molybdenum cofactor guanylyltransferase [Acidimicrobiia bacterium]
MGQDKAFVNHEGRLLADIARGALLEAGATEVLSVGGDLARLSELGFVAIADDTPGEGPLGGLLTALRVVADRWVVVLSCDLPYASAETVRELVSQAGEDTDAVVPLLDGRPLPTHAVWRRDCRELLGAAFAAGERRLTASLEVLRVRRVAVRHPGTLLDVDTPGDLRGTPAGGGPGAGLLAGAPVVRGPAERLRPPGAEPVRGAER